MSMYYLLCTGTDTYNVHVSSSDCVICNTSSLSGGSWPLDLQWRWLWLAGRQRSAPHCLSSSTPVLQSRARSGLRGGWRQTQQRGKSESLFWTWNSSTPPPLILMLDSSLSSSTIMAFQTASCADDFFSSSAPLPSTQKVAAQALGV